MTNSKKIIVATLLCSILLTGCNNVSTSKSDIQSIATDNFDKYIEQYSQQQLKNIAEDVELSDTEQILYDFLSALQRKDYAVAMRLSNYDNQPFVTEDDFKNGLSLNDNPTCNYANIVSKDLNNLQFSITPIEDNPDMMFTSVLLDNTDEYNGALVKINDTWKVAITGLRECTFEVPTNESLIINGQTIDSSHKINTIDSIDTYKVNLLNSTDDTEKVYTTSSDCVNSVLSGSLGDAKKTITFQLVCTDDEIEEFIDWELNFYKDMYKAATADEDLSEYFCNESIIETATSAIKTQKDKNIIDIEITNLFPTVHLDSPIKKIDNNTIDASVTIVISYKYYDTMGKLHTKEGVSDTNTRAIFKRDDEESSWKMDKILGSDPILTNSKFANI